MAPLMKQAADEEDAEAVGDQVQQVLRIVEKSVGEQRPDPPMCDAFRREREPAVGRAGDEGVDGALCDEPGDERTEQPQQGGEPLGGIVGAHIVPVGDHRKRRW